MVEHQRREPYHVFRLDRIPFGFELLKCSIDVESIPQHNDVDDQPERAKLILLALAIPLP